MSLRHLGQHIAEIFRPVPSPSAAEITAHFDGQTAHVQVGPHGFFLRSDYPGTLQHPTFDFALIGAVCIGLSHNINLRTDLPMSRQTVEAMQRLIFLMTLWVPRKIYPITLTCTNIVDLPPRDATDGIFCYSGGVDSSFSALTLQDELSLTHGVLIAGADYPDAADPRFQILNARARDFAALMDFELFTMETDLRRCGIEWNMLHLPFMSMCMTFHQSAFAHCLISADMVPATEMAYHPWSNNGPTATALSTPQFPLHHGGNTVFRSQKVGALARDPRELLQGLSICFSATADGLNCGRCEKCTRTRLNLLTNGLELPHLFAENPDLIDLLSRMKLPSTQVRTIRAMSWVMDNEFHMPPGPIKDAVVAYRQRLRASVLPRGRI